MKITNRLVQNDLYEIIRKGVDNLMMVTSYSDDINYNLLLINSKNEETYYPYETKELMEKDYKQIVKLCSKL